MRPTADPDVLLEGGGHGWWRYYRVSTGERWSVVGVCDQRGDCLIGATLADGTFIRDHDHLATLGPRPDSELDVPVTKGFNGCCPLRVVEL